MTARERIDSALAAPEPGAMEIADRVRKLTGRNPDGSDVYHELSDTEAAALIEQYGRRVPRKMVEDLWKELMWDHDFHPEVDYSLMATIFSKYGVRIEEVV